LSSSSPSGGAFNHFLNQINGSDRKGSDAAPLRDPNSAQRIFDAELAARLAAPARPDHVVRPTADVTPLPQRVSNLRAVAPNPSPPGRPLATADDDLAGEKFLDELEAWVRASNTRPKATR